MIRRKAAIVVLGFVLSIPVSILLAKAATNTERISLFLSTVTSSCEVPSSSQEVCGPVKWEGEEIGTSCVSIFSGDSDHSIINRISIHDDFKIKAAYLWMGPTEVSHLPNNYEDVPYEMVEQEQSSSITIQFANVSAADHLHFDCSTVAAATYVSKAVALVDQESTLNATALEAEVSFALQCVRSQKDGDADTMRLELQPVENQSNLRIEMEGSDSEKDSQHRELLPELVPPVEYDENGLPTLDWMHVRRSRNCPSPTAETLRGVSHILDEEFLRKAYISNYISGPMLYEKDLVSNMEKFQQVYEHFYAWNDRVDDQTLVVKIEGVCYAGFRATDPYNIRDLVFQNMDCCAQKIPFTNCFIRDSYYSAYYTSYVRDFEEKCKCRNSAIA